MNDDGAPTTPGYPRARRPATDLEARALAHPLRQRILRMCLQRELTNKQIAERVGRTPGSIHYHVRLLVEAGLLVPGEARAGDSGALEKPYRSTGQSWWLDDPMAAAGPEGAYAPVAAFTAELHEAGPASVQLTTRFTLHLSAEDVAELDRRILAVLDEYVETDDQRHDRPALGGILILHRLAE